MATQKFRFSIAIAMVIIASFLWMLLSGDSGQDGEGQEVDITPPPEKLCSMSDCAGQCGVDELLTACTSIANVCKASCMPKPIDPPDGAQGNCMEICEQDCEGTCFDVFGDGSACECRIPDEGDDAGRDQDNDNDGSDRDDAGEATEGDTRQ